MEAVRKLAEVVGHTVTVRLPDTFSATRVEVIVLPLEDVADLSVSPKGPAKRRTPPPELAGTILLDDLIAPAVPTGEWDATR